MPSRALLALSCLAAATFFWPAASGAEEAPGERTDPAAERGLPTPGNAVIRLRKTRYGKVLHEENSGLVAYLFTTEKSKRSRCYGSCAKAWPPIKTKGKPQAGSGIKQKHLGTTKRRKGARMVTYKGHPLYFYEHDSPGVVLCHDVFEFGGDWFVVKRNGKPA